MTVLLVCAACRESHRRRGTRPEADHSPPGHVPHSVPILIAPSQLAPS